MLNKQKFVFQKLLAQKLLTENFWVNKDAHQSKVFGSKVVD